MTAVAEGTPLLKEGPGLGVLCPQWGQLRARSHSRPAALSLDVPKLPMEVASLGPRPRQGLSPTQGWLPLWHRGGNQAALQDTGTIWKSPHCWPPPRKTPCSGNTGSQVPPDPRARRGDHEARPWLQEPLAWGVPSSMKNRKCAGFRPLDRQTRAVQAAFALHAHQGPF